MAINEGRGRSHMEADFKMSAGHCVKLCLRLRCSQGFGWFITSFTGKNEFSTFKSHVFIREIEHLYFYTLYNWLLLCNNQTSSTRIF